MFFRKFNLRSSLVAQQAGAYPAFRSMKRQGVFLLPLYGVLVHRRVTRTRCLIASF